MKSKNQSWPAELRTPIIIEEIRKAIPRQRRNKDFEIETLNAIWEERYRRAEVIGDFLGTDLPNINIDDDKWLRLLVAICRHWKIPAFQVETTKPRGPGATKIWTDQKHCELFADVMQLSRGALTEFGACKRIAQKPEQFGQRYLRRKRTNSEGWAMTLHRQFITAKKKIQGDQLFRTVHFSSSSRPALEYGNEFVDQAINQHAFKRNSSQPKSA